MRARSLFGVALATTLGCATAKAPATRPPGTRVAAIDPRRPDGALLAALAALPAGGPILDGLSAAARSDLRSALDALSASARSSPALARDRPLLALASGGVSRDVWLALAARGAASRELNALRPPGAPRDDLPSSVRRIVRAAALAYAHDAVVRAEGGAALELADVNAVADVARTLGDAHLRRLALERANALAATPESRLALALAAAEDLDPARSRELATDEDARATADGARLLAAADGLAALGGALADAAHALDAAEQAAKLGRFDLLAELVARAGTPPDRDLRAAVAFSLARLEGSTCMALERSREPADLCPVAWRAHPELADVQRVLAAAWASKAGRTPWSVETYAGLAHVIPLSYGSGAATVDEADRALHRHLDALRELLREPNGLAPPRGEALALLVDTLATMPAGKGVGTRGGEGGRASVDRARALVARYPADEGVARAAIAVAYAEDAPALATAVAEALDVGVARANALGVLGVRHGDSSLVKQAIAFLERGDLRGDATARLVLANELRAAIGGVFDPAPAERLLAEGTFVEKLRAGIDLPGAAARRGDGPRAEALFARAAAALDAAPADARARELLAAFETLGAVLLAARGTPDARLRAAKRLRAMAERDDAPPELRFYQALVARPLVERDERDACAKNAACLDAVGASLRALEATRKSARAALTDEGARLAAAGFLTGAGAVRTSLRYGIATGIAITMDVEPVVLVLPPAPAR